MADSPTLHTGFGRVIKEIWVPLHLTGKYEIECVGFFHLDKEEEIPFPIHSTSKDDANRRIPEDRFGKNSFSGFIDQFKPDLVWTCADLWMIEYIADCKKRNLYEWMGYFPIDGEPISKTWVPIIENMDYAVTFGKYGVNVIKNKTQNANLAFIPHGVNSEVFKPIGDEQRNKVRKRIIGSDLEKTIIGVIARNQPRKAFDKIFEAFFYLIHGEYIECNQCGKVSVFPYNLLTHEVSELTTCRKCLSSDCPHGVPRDDLILYLHGAVIDCGWYLTDLQNDYNLQGKIRVNNEIKIGVGLSEEELNEIYNACDIFTLPTRGEGFGLPILEAMSAGVPIVVTDYSAHPEWARGCGELVPPIVLEAEPPTNIRRAVIDMDEYVWSLLKLIRSKELRKEYGAKGREVAVAMDWKVICKLWETLIDKALLSQ